MTRDWQRAHLGDVLSIKHGFAFKSEYFADSGPYVVTTPGNFQDAGGFKFSEEKRKGYDGPIPEGYVLQEDDLLVAMTEQAEGLLGSTALVPVSGVFLHNQRLGLIRVNDPRHTHKRFIYYLFNSPAVRQQIRASASGTKVRHTSPSRIGEVVVSLPPFAEQARIADVLSAYDDLIENNTRRIAILEEMTRRIFEEWFVNFRAPGCEGVTMVESAIGPIPQGWDVGTLERVADLESISLDPRRFKEETFAHYSYPSFDRERLPTIEAGEAIQSNKLQFNAPVVLLGKLNPHIPRIWLVLEGTPFRTITSTEFMPLRARLERGLAHLHCLVCSEGFMSEVKALTGGTSTSHQRATPKNVMALPISIPPIHVVQQYEEIAMPMLNLAERLRRANANLRAQRDLLLPKLISGEIDIAAAVARVKEAAE